MCRKMCNSIQPGIKLMVVVYTDVWSFFYVTTTLVTQRPSTCLFVFRPPLSHSNKHHPQSTQWEMTRCARMDTSNFHPNSYTFLPQTCKL